MEKVKLTESRATEASQRKASGQFNCAQAVACTYAALVGAGMVLGLVKRDRTAAMLAQKRIMNSFHKQNGATICSQLKGMGTGIQLRHCNDCVADAATLLETELTSE